MLDNHHLNNSSSPDLSRQSRLVTTVAIFAMGGASMYTLQRFKDGTIAEFPEKTISTIPEIETVSALGRLEPKGEVIQLSAPATGQENRVHQLLVKEGDKVKANQVVAVLDNRDKLMAAFKEAKEAVKVAQANLVFIEAGVNQEKIEQQKAVIARLQKSLNTEITAKKIAINRLIVEKNGEIEAQRVVINQLTNQRVREIETQRATITRLERYVENTRLEYQRYQNLYDMGVISTSLEDRKHFGLQSVQQQLAQARVNLQNIKTSRQQQIEKAQANKIRIQLSARQQLAQAKANLEHTKSSLQKQINQAQANLKSIEVVNPMDVLVAKAKVNHAVAQMHRAEAELKQAYVLSPQDGQIFDIHTRPGERVSSQGIAEIGETSSMYAILEINQSDINKIRLGQEVKLLAAGISGELNGIVDQIGLQLQQQNLAKSDFSESKDSQVVEVHVRLDDKSSEKAARFTNLQVEAVVEI